MGVIHDGRLRRQEHGLFFVFRDAAIGLQAKLPAAQAVVVGDLMSITQTRRVADQMNQLGIFNSIIHNAGIGYRKPMRIVTDDGLSHLLAVNTVAPYILTALITRPQRLVYIMHQDGDPSLKDLV
jgi:short-subunit dehydrogenase